MDRQTPRSVPENADIEGNILGTVLLDPSLLDESPPITAADFFWPHHQAIWQIVLDLRTAGRQPSEVGVRDEIAARGWGDRTSGRDEYGNLVNGDYYITVLAKLAYQPQFSSNIIKLLELSRCRRGIEVANRLQQELGSGGIASEKVLDAGISDLRAILESTAPSDLPAALSELAQDASKGLGESSSTCLADLGAKTPWKWLDADLAGGFLPGDLAIIGARPNTGKTKIALAVLASACATGTRCGMISLDMAKGRLLPYIIPAFHNTRSQDFITGGQVYDPLKDGDIGRARFWQVCNTLDPEGNCYVLSEPRSASLGAISSYVRQMANLGCKVVLLDQLQNIDGWERGARDRGAYHAIFKELKWLPRRLNLALIGLHQIQREGADRPELKHLKETGCSEEFADIVILLHDYQSSILSTHGGFVLDKDQRRVMIPTKSQEMTSLKKVLTSRTISVHLAKSRSSVIERRDVMFDYVHGIAIH